MCPTHLSWTQTENDYVQRPSRYSILQLYILSILMVEVVPILRDTIYLGPLQTSCTAHTRYLRVSILLNTQYFAIRYWLYMFGFALSLVLQAQPPSSVTGWGVTTIYIWCVLSCKFASCIVSLVQQTTSRIGSRRRCTQYASSEKTTNIVHALMFPYRCPLSHSLSFLSFPFLSASSFLPGSISMVLPVQYKDWYTDSVLIVFFTCVRQYLLVSNLSKILRIAQYKQIAPPENTANGLV